MAIFSIKKIHLESIYTKKSITAILVKKVAKKKSIIAKNAPIALLVNMIKENCQLIKLLSYVDCEMILRSLHFLHTKAYNAISPIKKLRHSNTLKNGGITTVHFLTRFADLYKNFILSHYHDIDQSSFQKTLALHTIRYFSTKKLLVS